MGSLNINVGFKGEKTNKGFKFKDISFPLDLSYTKHDLKFNLDLEAISQSIKNLFMWEKGQRVLEPEYGNPILDILYEHMTSQTEAKARREIIDRLKRWEPRIQVKDVQITYDQELSEYYIKVNFSVPDLDNIEQTVTVTKK